MGTLRKFGCLSLQISTVDYSHPIKATCKAHPDEQAALFMRDRSFIFPSATVFSILNKLLNGYMFGFGSDLLESYCANSKFPKFILKAT